MNESINQGPHLAVEHNVNYDSHDTPLYFVMSADRVGRFSIAQVCISTWFLNNQGIITI